MIECVYQGCFNPIHNAHLEVAKYVHETLGMERIVFIPAFIPPHKNALDFDVNNSMHRLNMIQLAIEEYSYMDVSAIEYMRSTPSYTYETICQIYDLVQPTGKIKFIIGTDAFIKIESWHQADKLKELLDFILFIREENFDEAPFKELKNKGFNYTLMNKPFLNISASEIRERIRQNKEICDIVPLKVAEYIKQNHVYDIQN